MLLRFSIALFPWQPLVQALIFSRLTFCKSFMTCLPSVSYSLKLPGPLLCHQINLSKELYLPVWHSIFIVIWPQVCPLGTLLHTVMWAQRPHHAPVVYSTQQQAQLWAVGVRVENRVFPLLLFALGLFTPLYPHWVWGLFLAVLCC